MPSKSDNGTDETDGLLSMFGLTSKKNDNISTDIGFIGKGVKALLQQLFSCLQSELEALIQFGEKIDS